jgi:hypothetical protein
MALTMSLAAEEGINLRIAALTDDGGLGLDRLPDSQTEADGVEEVLTKELDKLSLEEKDKILFDVHGVPQVGDDDPDDVEKRIQDLEKELGKIKFKTALEEARYMNPEYVNCREFRLMFLRCERFDPKKAARKLVKHFEAKRTIFGGGEILGRDVVLSDLSSDDMDALEAGFMQILPTRDAAGRVVFVFSPSHRKFKSIDNALRMMWYLSSTVLKDEEDQKRGMVIVVYAVRDAVSENFKTVKRAHSVREGIPKKPVAVHYCYNKRYLRPFFAGVKAFMNREMRARVRTHCGTHEEIVFELQTYGIQIDGQPFNSDGSLTLDWHHEWLETRKTQELALSPRTDDIVVPRRFDVLFGRVKSTLQHTGNLRCIHLVEMNRERYESANKFAKTEIAERIVSIVYESYGRFLKWDNKVRRPSLLIWCSFS